MDEVLATAMRRSGMLTLSLDPFAVELKDGSISNIGAANKSATVKLYDLDAVETREFGDERVKLAARDDEGNEVEVALAPDDALAVAEGIETLAEESRVFE